MQSSASGAKYARSRAMLTWCPKGGLPFVDRVGANRRRASSEAWRATVPEWKAVKRLWDRTAGRGSGWKSWALQPWPDRVGQRCCAERFSAARSCVRVRVRGGRCRYKPEPALCGGRRSRGRHPSPEARVFEHLLCRSAGAAVGSSGTVSVDPAVGDEGPPVAQSVRRFGRFRCHVPALGTRLST
jgi:hypothetical protein